MICVINRLLNDCCFLKHRYHDTIRRANSTSLSADRSPRQLSKAKKSGSSPPTFFKKKSILRAFERVRLVCKTVSTISPLRKCGGGTFSESCMQHVTRDRWPARSPWLEMNSLACVPRNLRGVPKSSLTDNLKIKRRWGQKQEEEGAKASQ